MTNHRARRIAASLAAVLCALFAADNAAAQCQYEVTAVIQGPPCPPFGNPTVLYGRGMNSNGHVVGFHFDCSQSGHDHGFFWTPQTGRVTMHKPPGAWQVWANDINDNGLIVGAMQITGVGQRGFVYDRHTQQYLALLEPLHGVGGSSISAINESGIAVGQRSIGKPGQSPNPYNAVIWDTNTGEVIDLGVLKGPNSAATDICESGEHIVGWTGTIPPFSEGVIWTGRQPKVVGPLPNADGSSFNAVNDSGVAVGAGRKHNPTTWRAFSWDGDFTVIEPIDDWPHSTGLAINNLGQIFLHFSVLSQAHTPLLWQHGQLHYLQSLLVPSQPDSTLSVAVAANDYGQILCAATDNVALVLSPVDRPLTDLNADCVTDVHDLFMLLDAWGRVPRSANAPADFNGDGVVDVSDLLILLANWTMP